MKDHEGTYKNIEKQMIKHMSKCKNHDGNSRANKKVKDTTRKKQNKEDTKRKGRNIMNRNMTIRRCNKKHTT